MKVFISWSGKLSQEIAREIYEWLPMVIQSIIPYMSSESIEKGSRWGASVSNELENAKSGILIMTPDNINSTWLHFEAGALAKTISETRIAPVLFGIKPSDVHAPLSQFQVTVFEKDDFWKLIRSINESLSEEALQEQHLKRMFDALWDGFEQKIKPILDKSKIINKDKPKQERDSSEILEEILTHSRQSTQILLSSDRADQVNYLRQIYSMLDQIISPKNRLSSDAFLFISRRWSALYEELEKFLNSGLLLGHDQVSIRQSLEKFNSTILEISRDLEIITVERHSRARKSVFD